MARDNWDGCDAKYKGKVYVGGIGSDVTRSELETEYEKFGSIRDVWIAHNPPGFAFVEFHEERDGKEAIRATDGARVCGYKVSVEASHGRKSKRKTYLEDVRCYNCNRWGHLAKVCTRGMGDYRDPSPGRGGSRSPRRRSRSRSPRRSPRRSDRRSRSRSTRRSRSPRRSKSRSARRSRSAGKSRNKSRERSKKRSQSRDKRSRSREKSREKSQDKTQGKSRDRSREKHDGSRDRSADKSPKRSRSRERSEEKDPSRNEESVGREDFVKDEEDEM